MEVTCQVRHEIDGRHVRVYSPYCASMVGEYRSCGGKWEGGAWKMSLEKGMKFLEEMFGLSEDLVIVRVHMNDVKDSQGNIVKKNKTWTDGKERGIGGYIIARRPGRDSGVEFFADLVEGHVPSSGGSMKNPAVGFSDDAIVELVVRRDFADDRKLKIVWPVAQESAVAKEPAVAHESAVAKEPAVNTLLAFSDEQLIEELIRRGIPVPSIQKEFAM